MADKAKIYMHLFLISITATLTSCYATTENNGAQTQIVGGTAVSLDSAQNKQVAAAVLRNFYGIFA